MMLPQVKYLTLIMISVLLISCQITAPVETPPPPPLMTQQQIEHAAGSIDRSLIALYDIERAKKPTDVGIKAEPYPEPLYPSLSRLMTVDWSGPVEPLMRDIATLTKYRLKVMGHAPAIPVIVTLERDKITAQELLREIRAEIYLRGDILIFPDSGVIELHYLD
ncbi:MAG: DotD/TraH family lipoprotein [Legionellales bacterium]